MAEQTAGCSVHAVVASVTERIIERSRESRARYLAQMQQQRLEGVQRQRLSCGNLAHAMAASDGESRDLLARQQAPNLAIVTAYNDLLSAHQPYGHYPEPLKAAARRCGATAQVAGGVPAMCDGITQGRPGMELSLFSRDVIALSTAVALSHDLFDGVSLLGICDKIVPGLLIGALAFGHLPSVFIPSGPMPSGISNAEKGRVRQRYAQGLVDRQTLLEVESASYHSPGTCTFYGTANSNQMLLEIMGLQLPGSSFVPPDTPLREALNEAAIERLVWLCQEPASALGALLEERVWVNGLVGLLATGGSTNHLIHLVAMAAAAGVKLRWQDLADLSAVVPLLCRIYPNGEGDVNQFHAAGGMAFLIRTLAEAGLLHTRVMTVMGEGLEHYQREPWLDQGQLCWREIASTSADLSILRGVDQPFSATGGLRLLRGNLGQAVVKTSALPETFQALSAPVRIFDSQEALQEAFRAGTLQGDFIAVVRFQGPSANGMPELHQLTPLLSVLQDRGQRVALLTDGRMSGASGRVPAAIHLTPEAAKGGPLARLQEGDWVRLDPLNGVLDVLLSDEQLAQRPVATPAVIDGSGYGRELFQRFREQVSGAAAGASIFPWAQDEEC